MSEQNHDSKNTIKPKRVPFDHLRLKNSRGNISCNEPLENTTNDDVYFHTDEQISNLDYAEFYFDEPHYCNPKNHNPNCPNRKPKSMIIKGEHSGCSRNSGCRNK